MAHKSSYPTGSIPLNRVCYDNRDDITFRIYIMMTDDWASMKTWKKLKHGSKAKKHGSYNPKYLIDLLDAVKNTSVKNTKFAWKGVPEKGQILDNVHFAFDKKTGIYYPAGGGSRVAIAYFLCHSHIPGLLIPTETGRAWRKNFGVGTRHFMGMPEDIIQKMLFRREVNNIFIDGVISKNIEKEFLYKIPDLGFRGRCDRNDLLDNKEFLDKIKGKKVVNLIQDNGYLEVGLADHCVSILTTGRSSYKLKISRKMAEYYGKDNIRHYKHLMEGEVHDVALYMHGKDPKYVSSTDRTIFDNGKIFLDRLI